MADSPLDSILLPSGTLLGGVYAVEGALGKPGGFGITYLAKDTRLQANVAVKEFFPRGLARRAADGKTVVPTTPDDKAGFDHARERFLDEARMLARFHHPAIVRVRSFFEENGTGYLVMDYLEGRSLAAHLERAGGKVGVDTALAIARPLLDALGEIHAAGVLHRDVDPNNVYVTNKQQVVLLDFGAARQAVAEAEGGRSLSVVLKPGYAPYEQYASRGKQGPWTDLYGLAAMLYRMLTGVVPQESTSRILHDELRPVGELVREATGTELPPHVARAITWGLALRPEDRPQSAEAFEQALFGGAVPDDATRAIGNAPPVPVPAAPPPAPVSAAPAPVSAAPPPMYAPPAYAPPVYAQPPPGYAPVTQGPTYSPVYARPAERKSSVAGPVVGALLVLGALGGGFFYLTRQPERPAQPQTTQPVEPVPADPEPTGPVAQPDAGTFDPQQGVTPLPVPDDPQLPPPSDPATADVVPASPVNTVAPAYPEQAEAEQKEGRVVVRVRVAADGTVQDAEVDQSTDPVFDAAALKAALQWTFQPATRGGEAVEDVVLIPFEFTLGG